MHSRSSRWRRAPIACGDVVRPPASPRRSRGDPARARGRCRSPRCRASIVVRTRRRADVLPAVGIRPGFVPLSPPGNGFLTVFAPTRRAFVAPSAWPIKERRCGGERAPPRRAPRHPALPLASGRRNSTPVPSRARFSADAAAMTLPRTQLHGRRDRAGGRSRLERDRPRDRDAADPGPASLLRADPETTAAHRRGVSARRGFSTRSCRTSASVRPAAFSAGTNVVKSVSKARNSPPSGSPT